MIATVCSYGVRVCDPRLSFYLGGRTTKSKKMDEELSCAKCAKQEDDLLNEKDNVLKYTPCGHRLYVPVAPLDCCTVMSLITGFTLTTSCLLLRSVPLALSNAGAGASQVQNL